MILGKIGLLSRDAQSHTIAPVRLVSNSGQPDRGLNFPSKIHQAATSFLGTQSRRLLQQASCGPAAHLGLTRCGTDPGEMWSHRRIPGTPPVNLFPAQDSFPPPSWFSHGCLTQGAARSNNEGRDLSMDDPTFGVGLSRASVTVDRSPPPALSFESSPTALLRRMLKHGPCALFQSPAHA